MFYVSEGQENAVIIHPDQFDEQQRIQLASMEGWIFHAGNDKIWSQPNIDLSDWMSLRPSQLNTIQEDEKGRIEGWFRIKLKLSQAFDSIPLSLDREMWLASDAYLDGTLISTFGNTGADRSDFEHFNPNQNGPIPLDLQIDREYLLAIHLVNYEGVFTPRNIKLEEVNLLRLINLTGPLYSDLKQQYIKSSSIYSTLWITVSTIFMILFWLMYLQNKDEKVFMLIAYLSLANLLTILGTSLPNLIELSLLQEKFRFFVTVATGAITHVFMLMVGEWILRQKISRLSKVLLTLLPAASIVASFFGISSPFGFLNAVLIGYFIYLILTNWTGTTRVQWAIVTAMFLFLVSISIYIVMPKISVHFFMNYGNLWLSIALLIPLISLLIYMSLRFREIFQERLDQLEAVNKATAKVAEMKLIHDLNEMKSKFFANISHEFRTPLSLILGPLQRAKTKFDKTDEPYTFDSTSFNLLNRNAARLQNLVDQLLDLSKIESGHVQLSLVHENIHQFIKSIVYAFESMAESKGINYQFDFPSKMEEAYFDKDKLEKILTNLITNAIKYTPKNGTVTIHIRVSNGLLNCEVTDTGKGIKGQDLNRIFERFYRVEGSEEKGSGIGLALTKELVELHNGKISVSSTIGEGTTFKVRLPITLNGLPDNVRTINNDEVFSASKNHSPHTSHGEMPALVNEKEDNEGMAETLPVALVVEDNEDLRNFISSIINKKYQILLAKDGEEGERMALKNIPDIIISDVMMPRKDGFALCYSLKNNQKTSHIPIIMLTAKAGYENRMEGLTHGADAYLTKPFKEEELLVRMRNLVEGRRKIWEQFKSLDLTLINDLSLQSIDDQFLQAVVQVIKDNLDNELFSVEDLGREVGFSRSQLHRKLKAITNKSTNQLIIEIRLNEARRMLEQKTGTVSEIAFSVGYSSLPYFTKSFKKQFGVLPSKVV